ncbi:lamin tail domain-containing protein [Microbacterium abyssi]|uniref:lamin tail domain-containing protein n=1 Tax=Microbacterium abyssi TaxID=2782166 RepID=UPI001889B0CF|nr:lamin tail domain-containing protein [Microbacterium sp. A18JL241]
MSRLSRGLAASVVGALGAATLLAAPTAAVAAAEPLGIRINEVVSNGGIPDDWIEFYNHSDGPVDLTDYVVKDDDDAHAYVFPAGTVVEPGAYLVLDTLTDGAGHFDFGLGKGDSVRLFAPGDADGATPLLEATWPAGTHAVPSWGAKGEGADVEYAVTADSTKGAENIFPTEGDGGGEDEGDGGDPVAGSVVLNEVDSGPADWVELYNPGAEALDLSGYELRDNSDDHRWRFPAGSVISGGQFLVVEAAAAGRVFDDESDTYADGEFGDAIGIGSADEIRLFDASGTLSDRTGAWEGHANIDGDEIAATLARCPDGRGEFVLAHETKGAANSCVLPDVVINEIESNGDATDWIEVVNLGSTPVDMSGWTAMDDDPVGHAGETTPLAAGTVLEPGAYFVFDQTRDFVFGLGGGDTATIRDARGITVAEHAYPDHADGVWARCEDGTGEFADLATSTKGIRNACGSPVRINEVESDGEPDWVELVNPTGEMLDVSGIVVKDDDDTHAYEIAEGTSIPANGYLVIDELDFGIGKDDIVRVFDGEQLVDSTSWGGAHIAPTWGRCPDTTGPFAATSESTPGTANVCVGEIAVSAWPGSADVRALDSIPMFLEDSSGLDVQQTAEGAFLWAVDNGTGTIWKLKASADGSVSFADGWVDGKRVRFQKDASDAGAAGPDTEGITVDGSGLVYLASERDNGDKGVNQNKILQVDPDAAGPDLVALTEWDLTELLPAVGANLGIEAVEWVSDATLAGKLFDDNTNAPYDGSAYAGDGLFFVAVEDGGGVYAFALAADGSAELVSTIDPGLAGVMSLDYDSVLGVLWAVCDDGCGGKSAQITLNGSDKPGIAHFARPAGIPDINNEGFATAPASLATDGQRPVWWFADGYTSNALRTGTLPAAADGEGPDDGEGPGNGGGGGDGGSQPGPSVEPLPGTALVDGNRGDATVSQSVVAPGGQVTITVGTQHAGVDVEVWMYSDPVFLAGGTLNAAGAITVSIPTDAPAGSHRLAVYSADGELLGWANIEVSGGAALAATGSELPTGNLVLALGLLIAGALAVTLRRRAQKA